MTKRNLSGFFEVIFYSPLNHSAALDYRVTYWFLIFPLLRIEKID